MKHYDKEKTYTVVRMKFTGFSITIPHRAKCGGIAGRNIHFEEIDYGGKKYRCAKDHQEKVIYIDTHAMEEALEGSCRCGEDTCHRHGTEVKPPDDCG